MGPGGGKFDGEGHAFQAVAKIGDRLGIARGDLELDSDRLGTVDEKLNARDGQERLRADDDVLVIDRWDWQGSNGHFDFTLKGELVAGSHNAM